MATHDVAPGAAGGLEGDVVDDGLATNRRPGHRRRTVGRPDIDADGGLAGWLLLARRCPRRPCWSWCSPCGCSPGTGWPWATTGPFVSTPSTSAPRTPRSSACTPGGVGTIPGPLLFYALAPFLRLTGGDGHGLLLGALAVNTAAVAATLVVAARAGRRVLALTGLVLALLVVGLDPAGLIDPWNPYMLILPLFAAAVGAWRTVMGDRVAAVVLVVAGSFAVQSHVLAGPPVAVLLGVGAVGLAWRCWRGPERGHDVRTAVIAVGVGVVCWIPPIIEQLTHSPGNLRQIIDFALHGDETPVGWAVGRHASWAGPCRCRRRGSPAGSPGTPAPSRGRCSGLLVATGWAWRRRWTQRARPVRDHLVARARRVRGLVEGHRRGLPVPLPLGVGGRCDGLDGDRRGGRWPSCGGAGRGPGSRRRRWPRPPRSSWSCCSSPGPISPICAGSDKPLRDVSSVIDPTMDALRSDAPGPVLMTPTAFGIDSSLGIELLGLTADAGLDVGFSSDLGYVYGDHRIGRSGRGPT